MTDEYTTTITAGGTEHEVTLHRPGLGKRIHLKATLPEEIDSAEPGDDVPITPEVVEWCVELVGGCTDLNTEEVEAIPKRELVTLIEHSVELLKGNEPNIGADEYRYETSEESESVFDEMDLNDDGTVDLEEWR